MNQKIKQAMNDAGIRSVAALSRESGVAYGTTYDFVNGITDIAKMNINTLLRLCKALDIAPDDLYHPVDDVVEDDVADSHVSTSTTTQERGLTKLDDDEWKLVNIYRNAPESQKPLILAVAETIAGDAREIQADSVGA